MSAPRKGRRHDRSQAHPSNPVREKSRAIASPSIGSAVRVVTRPVAGHREQAPEGTGRRGRLIPAMNKQQDPASWRAGRTHMLSDSAVLSRRRNLRSSKSADRLTPAHPAKELVESDFAEATPGSIPAPQKQLRPRKRGERRHRHDAPLSKPVTMHRCRSRLTMGRRNVGGDAKRGRNASA